MACPGPYKSQMTIRKTCKKTYTRVSSLTLSHASLTLVTRTMVTNHNLQTKNLSHMSKNSKRKKKRKLKQERVLQSFFHYTNIINDYKLNKHFYFEYTFIIIHHVFKSVNNYHKLCTNIFIYHGKTI